jgi:hypothetical protein
MTLRLDREKTWTYEDDLALPTDGQRYEIIDGVLYVASKAVLGLRGGFEFGVEVIAVADLPKAFSAYGFSGP